MEQHHSASRDNNSAIESRSNNNYNRSNDNADTGLTATTALPRSPPTILSLTKGIGFSNLLNQPTLAAVKAVANALDTSPIKQFLAEVGECVQFTVSIKLSIASRAPCTVIDLSSLLRSLPEYVIVDHPIDVEDLSREFDSKTGYSVVATLAIRSLKLKSSATVEEVTAAAISLQQQNQQQNGAHSLCQDPAGTDMGRTRHQQLQLQQPKQKQKQPPGLFPGAAHSEQLDDGLEMSYSEADLWQMKPSQRRTIKLFLQDSEQNLKERMSVLADMQVSQKVSPQQQPHLLPQLLPQQQQLRQQLHPYPAHDVTVHHQRQHFAPHPHQESHVPSYYASDTPPSYAPQYSSFLNISSDGVAGSNDSDGNGTMLTIPQKKRDHKKRTDKKQKKDYVTEFPERLHFLLHDAKRTKQDNIITWLPCGKIFRVLDRRRLERDLLPRHFVSSTWRPFTKQLRLHSFKRLEFDAFSHPYFLRDDLSMVHAIKRRIKTQANQDKNASGRMRDKDERKASKKAKKASIVNSQLLATQETWQSPSADSFPTPDTIVDQRCTGWAATSAYGPDVSKNAMDQLKPVARHETHVAYSQGVAAGRPNEVNSIPGTDFVNSTAAYGSGAPMNARSNFVGVTRGVLSHIEPAARHEALLAEAERFRAQLEQQGHRFVEALPFPLLVTRLQGVQHKASDPPSTAKKNK